MAKRKCQQNIDKTRDFYQKLHAPHDGNHDGKH